MANSNSGKGGSQGKTAGKGSGVKRIEDRGFTRRFEAKVVVEAIDAGGQAKLVAGDRERNLGFQVALLKTPGGRVVGYSRSDQPGSVFTSMDQLLANELAQVADALSAAVGAGK